MKMVSELIAGSIALSWLVGGPEAARGATNESLADGNTAFAVELYRELKSAPGNLFFSPYSISTALAMTYAGARGDTQKQMSHLLHFGEPEQQVHAAFKQLQQQLREAGKQEGTELNLANALWAQEGHAFLPAFLTVAREEYQANVNQADFRSGAEAARSQINRWVAQNTKDKIQDILPPGSLTALTRLVLANAIYFKGKWATPYNKSETAVREFYVSTSRQASVPLMHHFDSVRYMEDAEFQAVELPYKGGALAMVVLLPRQKEGGLAELEKRMTPELLSRALKQMKRQRVEIFLPRFKLESRFDLSQPLAKMGMPDAFDPRCDFSAMDGTRRLYISAVFHKAWGEVNEEGTEAAAATTTVVGVTSAVRKPPPPPPVFSADHPFIFLIRDTHSGSLLFLGRLVEPAHG